MAYEFRFPDIGEGLTEGEVVEWRVKVGDKVSDHQVILEVETDKAVAEVPSPKAGFIISLKGGPGDIIKVGEVIAVIGDEAEVKPTATAAAAAPPPTPSTVPLAPASTVKAARGSVGVVGELEEAPEDEEVAATPVQPSAPGAQKTAPVSGKRAEALPKDRAIAKELGLDINRVSGTGPGGRVTEGDIRKASPAGMPEKGGAEAGVSGSDMFGPVERIPLRGVRRKIAAAMVESLSRAAQVTTTDEADVGLLWHIREKEKEGAKAHNAHLTFLPFIVKAVVGALAMDPYMNSSLEASGDDEKGDIVAKGYYNIGIAVETKDGLIVPNIKNADRKSILQIATEIDFMAERARKRTLDIKDLRGGTFTITNYGSIGGIFGTPILNYPEVGILGVGKIMEKPAVEKGAVKMKKVLPLSLTFDHRVVDGAKAQHFLNDVIKRLEDPDLILVGG